MSERLWLDIWRKREFFSFRTLQREITRMVDQNIIQETNLWKIDCLGGEKRMSDCKVRAMVAKTR